MEWSSCNGDFFESQDKINSEQSSTLRKNPFTDPSSNKVNFPDLTKILNSYSDSVGSEESEQFQDAKSFNWSIEHISKLAPVDIEFVPQEDSNFTSCCSVDQEAQKKIDDYFTNLVLPSPWTPNNSGTPHYNVLKTPTWMKNSDIPSSANSDFRKKFNYHHKTAMCQTKLTVPWNVNIFDYLGTRFILSHEKESMYNKIMTHETPLKPSSLHYTPKTVENLIASKSGNRHGLYNRYVRSSRLIFSDEHNCNDRSQLQQNNNHTPDEAFCSAVSDDVNVNGKSTVNKDSRKVSPLTKSISFSQDDTPSSNYEGPKSGMLCHTTTNSSGVSNSISVICGSGLVGQISDAASSHPEQESSWMTSFLSSTTAISPIAPFLKKHFDHSQPDPVENSKENEFSVTQEDSDPYTSPYKPSDL